MTRSSQLSEAVRAYVMGENEEERDQCIELASNMCILYDAVDKPGDWAHKTNILARLVIEERWKEAMALQRTYTWSLGEQELAAAIDTSVA